MKRKTINLPVRRPMAPRLRDYRLADVHAYQCKVEDSQRQEQVSDEEEGNRSQEEVEMVPRRNTYESNAADFYRAFHQQIAIRQDGLLVNKASGKSLGCSRLKKEVYLNPQLYSGLLRDGAKSQLLRLTAKLPGLLAYWHRVPERRRIIHQFQIPHCLNEVTLADRMKKLCTNLGLVVNHLSSGVISKSEMPLGAFGIVAHSKTNASLRLDQYEAHTSEVYPREAAVIGQCDMAFIFGEGSGEKELREIVAVVEMKVVSLPEKKDYHLQRNALCAQIFTSLIGSEAPLGIIVTNGMFKFIWREEVNGLTHFFTYPKDNNLADLGIPDDKEFFAAVMFDVVRCSMRRYLGLSKADSRRLGLSRGIMDPEDSKWRYITSRQRNIQNINGSSNNGTTFGTSRAVARDGSVFDFAPYDFTDWSPQEFETLQRHLRKEVRQCREDDKEIGEYADSFSGSSIDLNV